MSTTHGHIADFQVSTFAGASQNRQVRNKPEMSRRRIQLTNTNAQGETVLTAGEAFTLSEVLYYLSLDADHEIENKEFKDKHPEWRAAE